MSLEMLASLPPNILVGLVLFFILTIVIGVITINLLRANRRDRIIKLLRSKTLRKNETADNVILSSRRKAVRSSNRGEKKPFDFWNPAAINRDMRRAGFPQVWPVIYALGIGMAFLLGFTVLNAPLESFPPLYQAIAIMLPCFFFVRRSLLGMFIESRRLKSLRQLILFIESTQRAVSVGASPEDAVLEAIRESERPIRDALLPIRNLLELGYDFVEAITMASDQVSLPEFDIFVASLTAQSTTGGSVGDVLKEVVEIARSRLDLQKKVGTMTAEGRFNAFLLGALPIGLMLYLRYGQPDYFAFLWMSDFLGPAIFFFTIFGAVMGAFVAVRMSNIKV